MATRNDVEKAAIRKSGEISAKAMKAVLERVKSGVNLLELEEIATDTIKSLGGQSSFKTVSGYSWTTCLCVNDEVVHGIPKDYVLKTGDIVSIDLGAVYDKMHTDTAWTVEVDTITDSIQRFLQSGEAAMWNAVEKATAGGRIGDISNQMQSTIEAAGYNIVPILTGHGVGYQLHESPEIPQYGWPGTGPTLKKDMSLAIEVIYTAGTGDVYTAKDKWTIISRDKTLAGMFEMSVLVGDEVEVLTDWRKY